MSVVPSIETRLKSIAKALEQVVVPALPSDQRLAIEQAEIAIGHLRVLEAQWRYVLPAARLELAYLMELANDLLTSDDGGVQNELAAALNAAQSVDPQDFEALRTETLALGAVVERLIEGGDAGVSSPVARTAILNHAARQSRLERSWFAAAGISNAEGVPAIRELLAAEKSAFERKF
ncbi:hypothetical protein [uncultured Brevundimonas sp.]|uniref:hypothetical protein n=1 Tax=uncultured Brevundimonas sp. TaxID=213418 RepID=UPI0025CE44CD|nr:hypothetical protein [uncultured Brevundimonas sp.]